jgi:hypothetical protein
MNKYLPVFLVFASGTLWAQSEEIWIGGGASILANRNLGSPFSDGQKSDVHLDDGFRFSLRFDLNSAEHIGHEFQYAYNQTDLVDKTGTILPVAGTAGMGTHQLGYNLLYYRRSIREESKVRTFVTAGILFNDYVPPYSATPRNTIVRPGGNVGVGAKLRLSPLFGLRVDVREYIAGKTDWSGVLVDKSGGLLYQTEISAAFGVYF